MIQREKEDLRRILVSIPKTDYERLVRVQSKIGIPMTAVIRIIIRYALMRNVEQKLLEMMDAE